MCKKEKKSELEKNIKFGRCKNRGKKREIRIKTKEGKKDNMGITEKGETEENVTIGNIKNKRNLQWN